VSWNSSSRGVGVRDKLRRQIATCNIVPVANREQFASHQISTLIASAAVAVAAAAAATAAAAAAAAAAAVLSSVRPGTFPGIRLCTEGTPIVHRCVFDVQYA